MVDETFFDDALWSARVRCRERMSGFSGARHSGERGDTVTVLLPSPEVDLHPDASVGFANKYQDCVDFQIQENRSKLRQMILSRPSHLVRQS